MTAAEILTEEFEALKADLIEAYRKKGMRASGNWEREVYSETKQSDTGLSAEIWGPDYSQQLETGRRPGKFPPSAVIEKWIYDKGIASTIEGNISVSSLAFLIARKIAKQGWKREQYGGIELISEVVTPERINMIIQKVGKGYLAGFTDQLIKQLQAA